MKDSAEDFFEGRPLALARALERGDPRQIRELAEGLDLDQKGKKDMSFLWFAIRANQFSSIETLVGLGVHPDRQIAEGIGSAVDYALYNKDLQFLTAILNGGLSSNYQDGDQTNLLQRAVVDGSFQHVKLLLARGADVNLRDRLGETALNTAIGANQPEIGMYFVQKGADVQLFDVSGVSTAWSVQLLIDSQRPGRLRARLEDLRALMISKGAKFPPDSPEVVREQMRARGLQPVVPAGQER
jgi:uncharacterized protein